jgi:hypothetical protein
MEVGCHQAMMANEHIKIGSNLYEKVKTFKYLGSLLTNQNSLHKEIKCRLKARNSCYYSLQTHLSSQLLSMNLKIKMYKTIILSVLLYECKGWYLTLRETHRLMGFKNRILRQTFGPRGIQMGSGEGSTRRNFIVCTVHLMYSR